MKSVSAKDLLLVSSLSHFTQFDILNPANDFVVNPVLHTLGFALDRGLEYIVSYHRRLNKEACCGVVVVGEVRTDREFLLSPWCSAEDRIIAIGTYDKSLSLELSKMMGVQIDYGSKFALEDTELKELWQEDEDISRIEMELEALEQVLKNVRGEQRRKDGSLRRPQDYHFEEPCEKERRKKKNRVSLKHREVA